MVRLFSAFFVVVTLIAAQPAGEAGKTTITWHGQSFFAIRSSQGTVIVCDPHAILQYGRVMGLKANILLLSHLHSDHTQVEVLENYKDKDLKTLQGLTGKGNRAVWNPIDEKIKDVKIRSIGTYHDDQEGMKNGRNAVFVIEVDGWKIAHLGDLGHVLSEEQVKQIGPVDVLLIPVGGVYTINGSDALKVVEQLKPKEYIIPMHYGTPVYDDLLSAGEFLEGMPKDKILRLPNNTLVLDREPKRARPQVTVLHYWPQVKKK